MKTTEYKVVEDGMEYDVIESAFHKAYRLNGKFHRMLGPAMELFLEEEDSPVRFTWYYHGTMIPCRTQEEFERILKLKAFL